METGVIISVILGIFILIDLIIKTKTKTYAWILFSAQVLATALLLVYLIISIINKSNYYGFLFFVLIGFIGLVKQYLLLRKNEYPS